MSDDLYAPDLPDPAQLQAAHARRTELEDRLQDLAHRLTAERDQLLAMLLSADEADALLDLIIESADPADEPWGTVADKLVAQRDRPRHE